MLTLESPELIKDGTNTNVGKELLKSVIDNISSDVRNTVVRFDERNYNEIRKKLYDSGVSQEVVEEIISIAKNHMAYDRIYSINPDYYYDNIERGAGTEWREIAELTRTSAEPIPVSKVLENLRIKLPNLEFKIDDDYVYYPIKVRKKPKTT